MQLFMNSQLLRQSSGMSKNPIRQIECEDLSNRYDYCFYVHQPIPASLSPITPSLKTAKTKSPLAPVTNTFFKQQVFFLCQILRYSFFVCYFTVPHEYPHEYPLQTFLFQSMFQYQLPSRALYARNVPHPCVYESL